jgi:hypothetical protein
MQEADLFSVNLRIGRRAAHLNRGGASAMSDPVRGDSAAGNVVVP